MRLRIGLTLAAFLAVAPIATAEPLPDTPAALPACALRQVASLDITTEPDGSVAVPVTIEGREGLMVVDTGSIISVISESEARARDLTLRPNDLGLAYMGGVAADRTVRVSKVSIGRLSGSNLMMLVVPGGAELQHNAIGLLGPDILGNYDVEFDFAAAKLNLFETDHCPGQVVYWTKEPYAAAPMKVDEVGHIFVDIQLNGKPVQAALDTGADRSTISASLAKKLFGIDKDSPGMKPLGNVSVNGTAPAPLYRYPFATLTFEGVTVQNPVIDILDGDRFEVGDNQMLLGIKTMRRLHMYISYKEKMVYFTPAESR
jgi:predicted aspartyl protease